MAGEVADPAPDGGRSGAGAKREDPLGAEARAAFAGGSDSALGGADEQGAAAAEAAAAVVSQSLSALDALFEYLAARFRLEGYRFERQGRALVGRALVLLAGGAIALLGLTFASVGAAEFVSSSLGSRAAGPLIIGGVYLALGLLALLMAGRSRSSS